MSFLFWRYRPDLNWRITVLQTGALPLGYGTIWNKERYAFLIFLERVTRLELATSTLARWRSTGWATPASCADRRNRIASIPNSLTLVPPVGLEPTTRGFSVRCSTYWATEAYWGEELSSNTQMRYFFGDLERTRTVDLQRDRLAC